MTPFQTTLRALCSRLALATMMVAPPAALAQDAVTYTLEPTHTNVTWEVLHFGTSTTRGRIDRVEGQVVLDRKAGRGRVDLQIDLAAGLSTGIAPFTARLKETDLLATAEHPTAWFVAERLEFDGEQLRAVHGELTLKGVSRGFSLVAVRFDCYMNPLFRREVCGGDFEGRLRRSEFGMSFGLPFVADEVLLKVQAEGIRQ